MTEAPTRTPRPTAEQIAQAAALRAVEQARSRSENEAREAQERRAAAHAELAEKDRLEAADAELGLAAARERVRKLLEQEPPKVAPDPAAARNEAAADRAAAALAEWQAMVPSLYLTTDLADPRIHPTLRSYAAMWTPETRRGAAFVGRSGLGKTRTATMLLQRALEAGMSVQWVAHTDLAEAGIDADRPGVTAKVKTAARELLERCRTRRWLYLSDLGKGVMTERAIGALWRVAEYRTGHGLPIIWSAESGGDWLAKRLGDDRGDSAMRRLGTEFCDAPGLPRLSDQ